MTDPTIAARLTPNIVTDPIAPVAPITAPPAQVVAPPAPGTPTAPVAPVGPAPANPTGPVAPVDPTAPLAPVQGNELTDLNGGWQVDPTQVTKFASAVQQVRSDLDAVFQQVNQLTSPSYLPQLGSSPVGQALTAKFVDRLSGGQGLLPNLSTVLTHLDQFVSNAEQAASHYIDTETSTTDNMKSL